MAENILKILSDRSSFIDQIDKDLLENIKIIDQAEKECEEINNLMIGMKSLGVYPERDALIPLSKNFYVPGKIVHTGEYHVHKSAHPDSYILLKSSNETLKSLENDKKLKEKDIENAKYMQYQLEERKNLLTRDQCSSLIEMSEELPSKIVSNQGIAVKMGDFYEIFEYENE